MCWAALVCCLATLASVGAQRPELYEGDACKRVAGVEWTCKKLNDCPTALEDLKNGRRPENCGFGNNDEVIVCCRPSLTPPRPRPPKTTKRPTQTTKRPTQTTKRPTQTTKRPAKPNQRPMQGRGRKSKQMCRKYAESVFYNYTSDFGQELSYDLCAINVDPLITNGTKANYREFPHMALVGYGQKSRIQWKCGGSLISERWVLSAAHCTLTGSDRPKWVRLGEYNVRSTTDEDERNSMPVDFDIIQIINHPQYDDVNQYNDIALYKLNRDVEFNEFIRPVCLQTEYQIREKEGIISGWGRIGYSQKQSDILLKGNVTFMQGRECRDSLKTIENLKREIRDDTMICAANFKTNTDTCQGDSGGPLQYQLSDPYCMYSQVGITSFGIRCASSYPAVYTRVSFFIPWIESIVWP